MVDTVTADLKLPRSSEPTANLDINLRPSLQPIVGGERQIAKAVSPEEPRYKVYAYRWMILAAYCLIKFCSCATYSLFVPFSTFMSKTYGIPHVCIVLTSYTFNGMYPFASFFIADPFIQKRGITWAVFSPAYLL